MIVKSLYRFVIVTALCCSMAVHAFEDGDRLAEQKVIAEFEPKLSDIMKTLTRMSSKGSVNSKELLTYVDSSAIKLWSPKNTIRSMLGKKRWASMSEQEQHHLIQAYHDTVRRYLMENLIQFDRHSAEIESIKLNKKKNKGWLTLNIDSPTMSITNVDLKIYKEKGRWTVYDFRFKGVSFIALKKIDIRITFDADGIEGLISRLVLKNKRFFEAY